MATRSHTVNTRANFQRVDTVTWVGDACGRHGSYVFYKAFQFSPFKPAAPAASSSSVLVRTRTRDRRNTLSDSDITKPAADRNNEVDDNAAAEPTYDRRILSLGEFFFVQCRPEDPVCIGELQLLWHDKHSGQDLSSTRLYYLPETTPAGRSTHHGQDEVVAVSEKVVMRINDLASWIVEPNEWDYGCRPPVFENSLLATFMEPLSSSMHRYSILRPCVNIADVKLAKQLAMLNLMCAEHKSNAEKMLKEKPPQANNKIITPEEQNNFLTTCKNCSIRRPKAQVLVLSLTSYCRHKAVMKRFENIDLNSLSQPKAKRLLDASGAYTTSNPMLRIVFCRESFDYSQLFEHDLICEEFAPVFKGRPRKKNKKSHHNGSKSTNKKVQGSEDSRSAVENSHSDTKTDLDEASPNNRRRSKRKLPLRGSDDDAFLSSHSHSRLNKRVRRGHESSNDSSKATSKSEPSSPTDGGAEDSEANGIRRSKRRPRPRPTDLSIALRNSLLENHKIKNKEAGQRPHRPRSSASLSSSDSSRSSSPTEESIPNYKIPSPTDSVTSASSLPCEIRNVQTSPTSPPDFTNILTTSSNEVPNAGKDLDLSSDPNMYLRGLSEGHLPENRSEFLEVLNQFMRKQNTPIGRIPSLGFKKLDLWTFFKLSQEYGGYDMITAKRLWKHVYDRMGGNPSCTSAATCTRKHFEKLLLPLEKYLRLRQAIPGKDSDSSRLRNDEITAVIKSETSPHMSALNGRTFDGDVYFPNSATVANSSPTDESPSKFPSQVIPSSLENSSSFASKMGPLSPKLNTVSSGMALLTNGFNLESLVSNVVRSQFMNPQQSKYESPPSGIGKLDPGSNSVDLIDLTDGKVPSFTTQACKPTPTYYKQQNMKVSSRPQTLSVFTRTHCPRRSYAPPPFVPKAPSKVKAIHPGSGKKESGFLELSRSQQKDALQLEDFKLQKRPTSYATSSSSPKRPRDPLTHPDSHSNRRHHLPGDIKPPLHNRPDPFKPSLIANIKSERKDLEASGFASQTKHSFINTSGNVTLPPRHSTSPNRRDFHAAIEAHKTKHLSPIISDNSRIPPNSSESFHRSPISDQMKYTSARRYPDISEERKVQSYYRPTGMLATHRERQLQAKSGTPSLLKDEKVPIDDRSSRLVGGNHNDRPISLSRPMVSHLSKDHESAGGSIARPSKPAPSPASKQQEASKSSFSSFSVDRLTASSDRTSLSNGSSVPQAVHSKETRPHHPASNSGSSSGVLSRYIDPRQIGYRPPIDKDSFRSQSGHSFGSNLNEKALSGDAYSAIKRSHGITSSSDKPSTSQDLRSILDALPRGAQVPPDFSPAAFEHLLRSKLPFVPTATPHPQSLLPTGPIGQFSMLPEQLLQADSSLLFRRQQEQQLAAAGNMFANELTLLQLYSQQLAYSQLAANQTLLGHLPNPSSMPANSAPPALNRPHGGVAKLPNRSDFINQAMQLGAPVAMPQAPILVTNPQPQRSAADVRVGLPFPFNRR